MCAESDSLDHLPGQLTCQGGQESTELPTLAQLARRLHELGAEIDAHLFRLEER